MRRALLPLWPALSLLYDLHPWNTPDLTPDEWAAYLADLNRRLDAAGGDDVG